MGDLTLDYSTIAVIINLNFFVYVIFIVFLDAMTLLNSSSDKGLKVPQPYSENKLTFGLILISSFYLWGLFILVFITSLFRIDLHGELQIFPLIGSNSGWNSFLQLVGLIIISIATFVACWGRISRWNRAISWGVPSKLETKGMYRWIRHPLYASYYYYFIGFLLVFQSILLLPLLLGIPGYYYMTKIEEDILIEQFGEDYIVYKQSVGRFFPRLW
ncbi:MAG: methyltransferase family protein [Candidatus Hodarchaeales archaeon]